MKTAMRITGTAAALSGMNAAIARVQGTSHNVSNLLTEDFRPVRVSQQARVEGGVAVEVERAEQPRTVDLASELVDLRLSEIQFSASARVLDTELDMLGTLLDIDA